MNEHTAELIVTLERTADGWKLLVQPKPGDPHWRRTSSSVWTWLFQFEEYGHTLELYIDELLVRDGRRYRLEARFEGSTTPWSSIDGKLRSGELTAVAERYVHVDVFPDAPEPPLPLGTTPKPIARGGGHYHVKDAGGGGP